MRISSFIRGGLCSRFCIFFGLTLETIVINFSYVYKQASLYILHFVFDKL